MGLVPISVRSQVLLSPFLVIPPKKYILNQNSTGLNSNYDFTEIRTKKQDEPRDQASFIGAGTK